jgi:protein arginine kinase activator
MKTCLKCETTLNDFLLTGKVGCQNCYTVFGEEISALTLAKNGRDFHTGKTPNGKSVMENLAEDYLFLLKEKSCAEREGRFESLSYIKQKIRLIEEEIHKRGLKQ